MKKKLLIVLVLLTLVLTTGCTNKEAKTSKEFIKIMENNKYEIVNVKKQFENYAQVKEATIAIEQSKNYQIEFYVMSDEKNAKSFYENNREIFKENATNSNVNTEVNLGNYSKYTQTSNGKYSVISRIDNTIIYLNVDEKNKENIEEILETLGY